MANVIFKSSQGFADANVQYISGAFVPGGTGGADDLAPIGSLFANSLTGVKYTKIGAANVAGDWDVLSMGADTAAVQTSVNTLSTSLTAEIANRNAAVASEASARTAADATIQAEVDAIEVGAGLSVAGAYVPDAASSYIATATSIHNATQLLDVQLASTELKATTNAAAIVNLSANSTTGTTTLTNSVAAVQAELDLVEAGAGLSITGTYVPDAAAHYIAAATTIHNATQLLDAQLFATDAVATAAIPTVEKGAVNGVATLDASGLLITSQLPPLAISTTVLVADQPGMLALVAQSGDVAVRTDINKTFIHNGGTAGTVADWTELLTPTDPAMAAELNAVEAGAGLSTIGAYVANAAANYISGAVSLYDAETLLDAQVALNAANIATVTSTSNANAASVSTEATARAAADASIQAEVDAIEASSGLSVAGAYVPDTAASYIAGAVSLHNATQLLDAQAATSAAAEATATAANDAAHITMNAIMGNGTYSSTVNYLQADDLTVAVSKLDAAVSNVMSTASVLNVTASVVDSIVTKSDEAVKWSVSVRDTATPSICSMLEIFAGHDGDSVNDAVNHDWTEYAELDLNGGITGLGITVALAGTGAAQVMELSVSATAAVDIRVTRIAI